MTPVQMPTRRAFLRLVAAASTAAVLPDVAARLPGATAWKWVGTALGARASMTLYHADRGEARRIVQACADEVRRLERIFSLYRQDSALCRLNRDAVLDAPPLELVELLSLAGALSEHTAGAFDVTVQPLWTLYQQHFLRPDASPHGPGQRALRRIRPLVDYAAIVATPSRIRLAKPGMALTLNGIAQGYITDRVARLIQGARVEHMLLDLGEIRTVSSRFPAGRWRVGVPSGGAAEAPRVDLPIHGPSAVATSAPAAFIFEPGGRHHHLLDPATGLSASRYHAVTVLAPTAALADGLSTACSFMARADIAHLVARFDDVRVRVLLPDDTVQWVDG